MSKTTKDEIVHLLTCLILAIIFSRWLPLVLSFATSFSLGFFIDLDHLVDYSVYLLQNKKQFSPRQFLSGSYMTVCPFLAPLHSWELAFILFFAFIFWGLPLLLLFCLSLLAHLIIDQATNNISLLHNFLLYRVIKRLS